MVRLSRRDTRRLRHPIRTHDQRGRILNCPGAAHPADRFIPRTHRPRMRSAAAIPAGSLTAPEHARAERAKVRPSAARPSAVAALACPSSASARAHWSSEA